jgi:hypothetical protein
MNTRLFHKVITLALAVAAMAGVTSCNEKKFHIDGTITGAADSTLYFENMGLDGAVKIDSAKLSEDGTFAFEGTAPTAPEFYRLRIAGQFINIAVDSTETINIKAQYPQMATQYEVSGSEDCQRIKELSLMQSSLQAQVNAIARKSIPALWGVAYAGSCCEPRLIMRILVIVVFLITVKP